MPHWSNNVPEDPRGPSLPIRRTPPTAALVAVITSPDLLGCFTHYWHGRTQPCERPDCEPCREGMPYRWHAYMSALELKTKLHFLFETTAPAAVNFVEYREANGTLRGCLFRAQRWRSRPNSRIIIETKPADLAQVQLPQPPDLTNVLAILWSLPQTVVDVGVTHPENKTRTAITKTRPLPFHGVHLAKTPTDD